MAKQTPATRAAPTRRSMRRRVRRLQGIVSA
jgi:hypothetical protein